MQIEMTRSRIILLVAGAALLLGGAALLILWNFPAARPPSVASTLGAEPEVRPIDASQEEARRRADEEAKLDALRRALTEKERAEQELKLHRLRDLALPENLDYLAMPGLSWEGRKTLTARRPRTVGEIGSLPGVSQADVETLWGHLQARLRQEEGQAEKPTSRE